MNISIFYEKQDTIKTIRELTYHIGNVGVELKESNENRQDIDIAAFTYNDAKYIRKQMQVNNEDLYFLYIYIEIFSEDKKELEYLVNKVEGILQSNGIQRNDINKIVQGNKEKYTYLRYYDIVTKFKKQNNKT